MTSQMMNDCSLQRMSMNWVSNQLSLILCSSYLRHTHDIKSHCRATFFLILSSTCYVERFNKITSNLTKDNLLGRSALNLSSCCSAIGLLPFSKVNMNSQNVSLSLLHLSLLEHGAMMKWLASKFGNEDVNSRDQQSYQLLH